MTFHVLGRLDDREGGSGVRRDTPEAGTVTTSEVGATGLVGHAVAAAVADISSVVVVPAGVEAVVAVRTVVVPVVLSVPHSSPVS